MNKLKMIILLFLTGLSSITSFAWEGMPTPALHVEGRFLKDPNGNTVVLRGGWMQPTETWFNGGGRWYSNPTDWTNPGNVAGMLNYLKDAATVMSNISPRYGRNHGWYSTFVRMNTDAIGGWTQQSGLVNQAQFNGWIQNFLVPYANHLKSRGLYLILSATGPINTPNNGSRNAGVTEQARLRTFWSTVANAPGVRNADNIMFELMNEPVEIESSPGNGDWGMGQAKYFEAFRNWMQPVIDDVRRTGANNVIWVPTLEWQGSPQQHLQYPFTGSNVGVAVHYYPAYGNCRDNVTCHNNLWNRQYKPVADRWPMIITENFWFPEDVGGLVEGSTVNYGNTLRANMEASGNVSYMIGFLSDLLDLNNALPANASLSSKQGAQAAFSWFYQDNSCSPTSITPYVQVNDGAWQQTSSVTISSGAKVEFGPQPVSGGSWSWSGCGTSGSGREQTVYPTGSCTATVTYTNACGARSTQNFNITVTGATLNGIYSLVAQHSGKAIDVAGGGTSDGTNIQQWFYYASNNNERFQVTHLGEGWHRISPVIASGQALDVSGVATANGANIQSWGWNGGTNQQWRFESAGNGYWKIIARHSNKCLDVEGVSSADGANVHQWDCISGAQNQAFQLIESNANAAPAVSTTSLAEDIIGVSCGQPGMNYTFELNSNNQANATSYNWWTNGFDATVTQVAGQPWKVNVTSGAYFTGGQLCAGVNYSGAPYYKEFCKSLTVCNETMAEAVRVSTYPNPAPDKFKLSTESVHHAEYKVIIVNTLGEVMYTREGLSTNSSYELGENLPEGIYHVMLLYNDGSHKMINLSKLE